ncbi:hypothetical protein [Tahibacter sp.]|uniref:hypothetical protein n=1 Tax=Tahibacter sp. TaxID=2056211 RepID=UPI0028C37FCA|nr:hypothetical protein [Tahibacter sp.]
MQHLFCAVLFIVVKSRVQFKRHAIGVTGDDCRNKKPHAAYKADVRLGGLRRCRLRQRSRYWLFA